jgi:hypothetical protein
VCGISPRSAEPRPDLPPAPAGPPVPPWASSTVIALGLSLQTAARKISLFLDIGQGAGLAGATGVRPFLPPLLAGALARTDAGIDFDQSPLAFLESPVFLLAVLALAVTAYLAERRSVGRPLEVGLLAIAAVLGGLLFAGALAAGGRIAWPGLLLGALCAALGNFAVARLLARARRRAEPSAANLFPIYGDALALLLAAAAVFVPPVGLVALAIFAVLALRGRSARERKYEGLRVLR